jgi:hypothetical protein
MRVKEVMVVFLLLLLLLLLLLSPLSKLACTEWSVSWH